MTRLLRPVLLALVFLALATKGMAEETVQITAPEMLNSGDVNPPAVFRSRSETLSIGAAPQQTAAGDNQSGISVGVNFTGSTLFADSFFIPPDTMGAVGPDHIVELINGRYSVYRKNDGVRIQTSSLDEFWRSAGVSFNAFTFDPRVLYDPFTQRWFASSADNAGSDNQFLVAVSKSPDPTAGWLGFAMGSDSSRLRWADFPTLGINHDGVFLSANMIPIDGRGATAITTTIVALPKDDLVSTTPTIAGASAFENNSSSPVDGTGAFVQAVADLDGGGLPASVLSSPLSTSSLNFFKRTEVVGDMHSPSLSLSDPAIAVSPMAASFNARQPGLKAAIEIVDGSIFHANMVKQNGAIWGVQTVNYQGHAALRWFRIAADTNTLIEEGLIADGALDFYYGSIAVNKFDDVVIGFNGSSDSQFISTYAVKGATTAGTTRFGAPLQLKAGAASYFQDFGTNRNRWGDYSATVIDPADPFMFWTFQEFVSSEDHWSTQISQLITGQPENVNSLVSFVADPATFATSSDTSGCPSQSAARFTFAATLSNEGSSPLSHLLVKTTDLSNDNLLENADYAAAGIGANLTVPRSGDFSDGILTAGESIRVPFSICLSSVEPFSFFVDVIGIQENDTSNSVALR